MEVKANNIGIDLLGIDKDLIFHRNLGVEDLVKDIIQNEEGVKGLNGSTMIDTGIYTGRSPKDKYIVSEKSSEDKIWWGDVNRKISEEHFKILYKMVIDYYNSSKEKRTYLFDGYAGADKEYSISVRVLAKRAWQAHFAHNMFIREREKQIISKTIPDFTIINASDISNPFFKEFGMNSKTFIIFHLGKRIAIIGGTEYGGEMKKGIFSVLHYILPQKGVLSMHCAANVYEDGTNPAIFFGLSGTGKTTLSTDPLRPLIGDDEHGWSDKGIFNFEGGCYAKVINLDPKKEPDIYKAIREGALLENVVYDKNTKEIDFTDGSKTENTRVSYPISHIKNSLSYKGLPSISGHPEKIIFLTCDAYGILPPISKMTVGQAMYHFISGYTAKIAGTERGVTEPVATFSPCFGGPFLTLHPLKYAKLLEKKIIQNKAKVYLVNTGWVGASASSGAKRIDLDITRIIINKVLGGEVEKSEFEIDPYFHFKIPVNLSGINVKILKPELAWDDNDKYHQTANSLVSKFQKNYKIYDLGDEDLLRAGPSFL